MIIYPVSKCQSNFSEVTELCRSEREGVFITRNGYEDLVLMSAQEFNRSIARLELYDKLAKAQQQIDAGIPLITHDKLFQQSLPRSPPLLKRREESA